MSFYTGHLPAASNRADFMFAVEVTDPITNDFVNFVGSVITVSLRPMSQLQPILTGTNLDNQHITVTGDGMFEVIFSRAEMTQFQAGELDMGITVKLQDGITYQLFAGQVPIVDGVVAQ
jgi:hypothetical protein